MIEVFHYDNLSQKVGELEYTSASETRSINAAYTLQASVLPRTLKKKKIAITPFTVYRVDGIFYRQLTFSAEDNETGLVKIDAIDLLFADLAERDVPLFNHNTTAQNMLSVLLAETKFTAGACDDLGSRKIDMKNTNKLSVLIKILELFGGELDRHLLKAGIRNKLEHFIGGQPFRLEKGRNILTLEESIDTGAVITQLRYVDGSEEDAISRTITSPFISNYPVKEGYKEFKTEADVQALSYLEANELPHATYKVSVPFNFKRGFRLGTVTQLFCEQIGINLRLRVVEITRDLTGQTGDSYVLGQKPKSFVELTADLFMRDDGISDEALREIIEDELEAKLELVIPEIVDEIFELLEFDPLPDYLLEENLRDTIVELINDRLEELDLGGGDCIGGGHIILDHHPTQTEVDSFPHDAVILVYDPEKGGQIFGKTAFQSAIDGGFTGTELEFNSSIASVGNVSAALTEIIGDEI